jgi:hypothetical protein
MTTPPSHWRKDIFTLSEQLAEDLATVGLKLQPHKSKCYIDEWHRDYRWNELRGIISNGTIEDDDRNVHYGITTCNIPIGSVTFVKTYPNQKMNGILKGFASISNLLSPERWPHPDLSTWQMLWILTLFCIQFMGDYWLRHICPDYTAEFAQGLDEGIRKIFQMCIGIDIDSWTDFAKEWMQHHLVQRLRITRIIQQTPCTICQSSCSEYPIPHWLFRGSAWNTPNVFSLGYGLI